MSSDDSKIVAHLVRMVVPMRREFGQNLDVQHFLHDLAYAEEVLRTARGSQDQRLREYADYVAQLRLGPRLGEQVPPSAPVAAPAKPSASPPMDASAEELRARIMRKYTSGLR